MADKRNVPFFHYPHIFGDNPKKYTEIMENICKKGSFILQEEVALFEKKLAEYCDCKYAIGVANATDALHLSLIAAGIGIGDEVIFSSHTYVATASAIHFVGATPIPVECQADHQICPNSIKNAITEKTKAIMPTQLNGRVADMDAVLKIADEHNLVIIEDSAQGLGAKYKNQQAGTFGLAGVFSFYPAKTLGCFGDGGAVITNSKEMNDKIRSLRFHGRDETTGEVKAWGLNSRLDNLHAAVLLEKLSHFDNEVQRRREIALLYDEMLASNKNLALPPRPSEKGDHYDSFQNYEIRAEKRDALKQYLQDNNIGTIIQWAGKPVHLWEGLGFDVSLPFTEEVFEKCILLPMNTSLSNDDVIYVANTINQFYM